MSFFFFCHLDFFVTSLELTGTTIKFSETFIVNIIFKKIIDRFLSAQQSSIFSMHALVPQPEYYALGDVKSKFSKF